ncbi:MAG TPA: thioesterase family protein [Actinomycetota bacterium]|nr:thioesterase family protein [Actinomycetota bacterium]
MITRRIQWFDTDASTKYHNTAPLRLMEEAEVVLLDRLGILREVYGKLPRAHASIDYRAPLRFWDECEVRVEVSDVGRSSITYAFTIAGPEGQVASEGRVVAVLVDDEVKPRAWPQDFRSLLLESGPLP